MSLESRSLVRLALRLMLVLLPIATTVVIVSTPTGAQDTEEVTPPVEESVDEAIQEEPTEPAADIPTEPETVPAEEVQEPVDEPTLEPTEEPSTEIPPTEVPPPSPTLGYDATAPPTCLPLSADPAEPVAGGGDLEYTCTFTLALDGAYLDPASIALDWTLSAAVGSDWSVQLLDPTGVWTEPGLASAGLGFQTVYTADTTIGTVESLQDVAAIQFGMRLHRPVCSTGPVTLELDASGYASIPGNDQAIVTAGVNQPAILYLEPVLAPIDTTLPTVSIVGVSVDPIAFSLTNTQTYGQLTILVENPVLQCRAANVAISIQASAGAAIENAAFVSSVGPLDESTIAGAVSDVSGEGSALDGFVVVSTLQNRAEAGSYFQTIDFELTVPGAIAAGAYQLDAAANVEAVE